MSTIAYRQDVAKDDLSQRQDQQKQQLQVRLAPLTQALQADQTRLAIYADPDNPMQATKGKEKEYEETMKRMEGTIGQMRTLMGAPPPKEGVLDHLHIRRDLASRIAKYNDQTKQTAQATAAGAMPFEQTAEGQKAALEHKNRMGEIDARNAAAGWTKLGVPAEIDGKFFQALSNKSGETKLEPMPEGWKPPQKTVKVEPFEEFVREAYGDKPTSEQLLKARSQWAEAAAGTTVGTHDIQVPQPDGSIKLFSVTTTSRKEFPGAAPSKGGSTPPAKGKPAKTPEKGTGTPPGGRVVGGRTTAVVVKAQKDYVDAVALADIAKSVSQHPDDAINQKRLAVQLEKASAGRFTVQALDYIIKAGWGNTLEQWANNPSTGALPSDVLRQLVDGANENLNSKKTALDAAQQIAGSASSSGGGGETITVTPEDMKNARGGETITVTPEDMKNAR